MKKIKIDLLIFDLDGTLIDSQKDIADSVNYMLEAFGLPKRGAKEITGFIGKGVRQLMIDALGKGNLDRLAEATKIYKDYYRSHMFDTTILYPNVKEVLGHFKDKKKAIISNKSIEFSESALERFNISGYFLKVAGGDDENCRKPSACPLINIMKEFGCAPKKTIIIGDSDLDIETGKNAGILTCGVTYGIGKKEGIIKAGPDFVIDDIGKLRDLLE